MDTHTIEIAVRDANASWCACTCGWTSEKASEDDVAALWGAHVAESSLTAANERPARA
jgi:hypothetical protein